MALWVALLVALASSLLNGGMPRTTALGSAFNPATTSVVLKPIRPAPRLMVETVRRDDGPAAGAGGLAILAPATVSPPPVYTPTATAVAAPEPHALRSHSAFDGSPRGPPLS